ncbi:hypothetical protein [Deinococcus kurensis]|uniref:hypothetical protein n=1 Tax=Deinococcus kurensis TaxID=2662757 RepID=UPI0012D30FB7|nr:hypothetical protein [Deinococcus kurensis]
MRAYPITHTSHALDVLRTYHPRLFRQQAEGGCMPFYLTLAQIAHQIDVDPDASGASADMTRFIVQTIIEARSWTLTTRRADYPATAERVRVYGRAGLLLGEHVGHFPLVNRVRALAAAVALSEGLTVPRPQPELPAGLLPLRLPFTAMLNHLTHQESA